MPSEPVRVRSNIGKHIAEKVVGDDDDELFGPTYQLHAASVGQHMIELHVLELARGIVPSPHSKTRLFS